MKSAAALLALARAHGIQTSFLDAAGRRRRAGTDALTMVLRALGEPLDTPHDAADALRRLRSQREQRVVEPVLVAWSGRARGIDVRLPRVRPPDRVRATVELEGGEERSWTVPTDEARSGEREVTLRVDGVLPIGRHTLTVEVGRRSGTAVVLAAPRRVRAPVGLRDWGAFLPLHALATERTWGIGDLTALAELADWVRDLGGGFVATLPLLAGVPGEPSPYRPASRMFWDERYVDVSSVPEFEVDEHARRLVASEPFPRELDAVRRGDLVDHERVRALKRRVLERLAKGLEERGGRRASALRRFLQERPDVEDYARFRAVGERLGIDPWAWPSGAREGRIETEDVDPDAFGYHRYVQWVAEEQVAELGRRTKAHGTGLYLDMPLGVHPDGYDVWRHRSDFATAVSVGSPPDEFFSGGQVWGFPPLHPERVREDGYAYPLACLRHVFRHAGVVRIDHVIGLHRQFWVPHGFGADRGVFVRYPAEEWYAAIALEAHRAGTAVVGEDLGTVPRQVRSALRRHGMLRSYVLQFEVLPERQPAVAPPAPDALASLNTHDLPTFAAFWRRRDIRRRVDDGLVEPSDADALERRRAEVRRALQRELVDRGLLRRRRAPDQREVLAACLAWLAASDAAMVVVNLEDLWFEARSQNVPGTSEGSNWRRRAARSLGEIRRSRDVLDVLEGVHAARRRALEKGDAA